MFTPFPIPLLKQIAGIISDSSRPLRFSRSQYGIFKNFQDANLLTLVN
jgi:hypothetical protein